MSSKQDRAELLQGTLDLIVLRALSMMGPLHAFGLASRLEQVSHHPLLLNQGTLYPALVRLEQFYPFPAAALRQALAPYADETPAVWVQEEPENMGAWRYLKILQGDRLVNRFPLTHISRDESASPATGSRSSHELEQNELVKSYSEDAGSVGKTPPGSYVIMQDGKPKPTPDAQSWSSWVPGFSAVSFALDVGDVAMTVPDPELSPFGYHVIKRIK